MPAMPDSLETAREAARKAAAAADMQAHTIIGQAAPVWTSETMLYLSTAILLFGFLVISLAVYLLKSRDYSAEQVLRVLGTLVVIVAAVFLMVAGYTESQIAPAIGLMGTVVGYLLGTSEKGSRPGGTPTSQNSA